MAAHIRMGDLVMVVLPEPLDKSTKPIWKYQHQRLVVKKKKPVCGYRSRYADSLFYYELYGAKSDKGTPYGFLADWLVKL